MNEVEFVNQFCKTALELQLINHEDMEQFLEQQRLDRQIGKHKAIGQYFVESGLMTEEDVRSILQAQEDKTSRDLKNMMGSNEDDS